MVFGRRLGIEALGDFGVTLPIRPGSLDEFLFVFGYTIPLFSAIQVARLKYSRGGRIVSQ